MPEDGTEFDTASARGWVACHVCSRLAPAGVDHCPRCGSRMHARKPHSVQATWAWLLTAAALYIPAMLLPVSSVKTLGATHTSTLMGSVVDFLAAGAWPVALVIFIASVVVPLMKLLGLGYLLVTIQAGSTRFQVQRTRLYRMIEFVGRWSMIDVFVVALLVVLVQVGVFASIEPGPGILAFAAVVVLTIFAADAFDPRLIWDPPR